MCPDNPTTDVSRKESEKRYSQSMLEHITETQAEIQQSLSNLEGQHAFLRQQLVQVTTVLGQQLGALQENEIALRKELGRFQTGGPQHAMAAIFHKLFRDLLKHSNQLDALAALSSEGEYSPEETPWLQALRALQGGFETILIGWGCTPIPVQEMSDLFDAELHEAVTAGDLEIPDDIPENVIVKVVQRGWRLHDTIVQYPRVIVS